MKKRENRFVLLAEDDEDDYLILRDAFDECCPHVQMERVKNGEELVDYLMNSSHLPSVILLDLNMPKKDGREALTEIKDEERLSHIPIVALTTSSMQADILKTYRLGITNFIRKPSGYTETVDMVKAFDRYWFEVSLLP